MSSLRGYVNKGATVLCLQAWGGYRMFLRRVAKGRVVNTFICWVWLKTAFKIPGEYHDSNIDHASKLKYNCTYVCQCLGYM